MPPVAIDSVLFDLDGTLIDSVGLILDSYSHVHREHLPALTVTEGHYRSRLGVPLLAVYQELVGDHQHASELVRAYKEHNRKLHDDRVGAYPGVEKMLEQLSQSGTRLAIVTSKGREVARRGLRVCGIERFFNTIVALEDVGRHKPDPEPVHQALQVLGASPEQSLMVGDAPSDIRAGKAAGVHTGAALWGPFGRESFSQFPPDLWIEDPCEIPLVLGDLTRGIRS